MNEGAVVDLAAALRSSYKVCLPVIIFARDSAVLVGLGDKRMSVGARHSCNGLSS